MAETFEDIRNLREQWEATLPVADYRQRMIAKAEEMAVGDPGRAELLECLASDLEHDEPERALELARAAVTDGGPTTIDARIPVVRALFDLGREAEADALVRELLRARPRAEVYVGLHAALGETLELLGRIREAQRAYTVGLKELDPDLDAEDLTVDESLCLAGRYRARRALDLGRDRYDRLLEEVSPRAAAAIRERSTEDSGSSV